MHVYLVQVAEHVRARFCIKEWMDSQLNKTVNEIVVVYASTEEFTAQDRSQITSTRALCNTIVPIYMLHHLETHQAIVPPTIVCHAALVVLAPLFH